MSDNRPRPETPKLIWDPMSRSYAIDVREAQVNTDDAGEMYCILGRNKSGVGVGLGMDRDVALQVVLAMLDAASRSAARAGENAPVFDGAAGMPVHSIRCDETGLGISADHSHVVFGFRFGRETFSIALPVSVWPQLSRS